MDEKMDIEDLTIADVINMRLLDKDAKPIDIEEALEVVAK